MSKEKSPIPLSKPYNPSKLNFPVYVSLKLDGMPVLYTLSKEKITSLKSRQNTDNISSLPRARELQRAILSSGEHTFVAEMTHRTDRDFKTVSGHVRRGVENDDLIMNIFDYAEVGEITNFQSRTLKLQRVINRSKFKDIRIVEQFICYHQKELDDKIKSLMLFNPNAEGLVIRSHDDLSVPNSRSWGYQKLVIKPTMDLEVHRFYEAMTTDTKEPKGMVGGMYCWFKEELVKVPAGKLKHGERERLWKKYENRPIKETLICEVQYKKDDSYDRPREPVFLHWRPEKGEASYE